MPTAHILCDVSDQPVRKRIDKAARLAKVLELIGFSSHIYSREICDQYEVMNVETQLGSKDGYRDVYSNKMLHVLSNLPTKDLIFTTEAWHSECFRNLCEGGKYYGCPVIETWIDYSNPWALYRIYASEFNRTYSLKDNDVIDFNQNWIVATPYFKSEYGKDTLINVYEYNQDPFSVEHLQHIASGVPVIGPDWGAFGETVQHGVTGVLYRSEFGKTLAKEQTKHLPSKAIKEWAEENLSAIKARKQIEAFIGRLTNG